MTESFVEKLKWYGMLAQMIPGTEGPLEKGLASAYLGIDPTADSLHTGHLYDIMTLRHLQRCGHKPYLLLGGAAGMVGDPPGKSLERNLLDTDTLYHSQEAAKQQMSKFLDFNGGTPNKVELMNNYDWTRDFTFLDFAHEVGKHITANYMVVKNSVKGHLNGEASDGLSLIELTYQLLQGCDFLHPYQKRGIKLQLGGNDQWGGMTTDTELIRRAPGAEESAYCPTCLLITEADGEKFDKTENDNVWLDRNHTAPYAFYQLWLNVNDNDTGKYIKIFTSLEYGTIEALVTEYQRDPGRRVFRRRLAEEVTVMVHLQEDLDMAVETNSILFGRTTKESLRKLDEATFLDVLNGVLQYEIDENQLDSTAVDPLDQEGVEMFPSEGEMRKLVKGGDASLNKEKLSSFDQVITTDDLISGEYLLVQCGKKNCFLITIK